MSRPRTPAISDNATRPRMFHDLLEAHLGRLAAGVTLIFSVLKVLSVAHFDVTTALGVVAESNSAPLLLGAVVTAIDFVLLVVMASLLYVALDEKAIQGPDSRIYAVLGLVVAVLAAALAPLPASIVVFLPGLTILGQRGLRNRRSTRHFTGNPETGRRTNGFRRRTGSHNRRYPP